LVDVTIEEEEVDLDILSCQMCEEKFQFLKDFKIHLKLSHNFEGKVISHSYFGKAVPDMPHCLDDLRSCKGWEKGYVICRNVTEVRDANGEIVQLTFEEA